MTRWAQEVMSVYPELRALAPHLGVRMEEVDYGYMVGCAIEWRSGLGIGRTAIRIRKFYRYRRPSFILRMMERVKLCPLKFIQVTPEEAKERLRTWIKQKESMWWRTQGAQDAQQRPGHENAEAPRPAG